MYALIHLIAGCLLAEWITKLNAPSMPPARLVAKRYVPLVFLGPEFLALVLLYGLYHVLWRIVR